MERKIVDKVSVYIRSHTKRASLNFANHASFVKNKATKDGNKISKGKISKLL